MNRDIGLTPYEFGWGAGLLFATYSIFEIPSNLILYRLGARRWIARIMITWGLVAVGNAFVVGPASFYIVRLLLGAAEVGFFPGITFFLASWFPSHYRARVRDRVISCARRISRSSETPVVAAEGSFAASQHASIPCSRQYSIRAAATARANPRRRN